MCICYCDWILEYHYSYMLWFVFSYLPYGTLWGYTTICYKKESIIHSDMSYVFFQLTYTFYNYETTNWFTVWRFKTNCQFKCNSNSISRKWTLRSTRIRVNISLQFHFNELYNLFISVYQLPKPPWKLSIWLVAVKCVESALLFDFVTFSSPKDLSRRFPSGPVFFVSNLFGVSLLFVLFLVDCWLVLVVLWVCEVQWFIGFALSQLAVFNKRLYVAEGIACA